MVSPLPLISKPSKLCINPFITVLRAPVTIGISVTFMVHNFFQFSSKVQVLILLFDFVVFYSAVSWYSKVHNTAGFLFL